MAILRNKRISVGEVSLDISPGWTFYSLGPLVVGGRDDKAGVLQISTAYRHAIPDTHSHEACFAAARGFLSRADATVVKRLETRGSGDDLFGTATFETRDELIALLYRYIAGGLVVAMFSSKLTSRHEPAIITAINESERMVRTLVWSKET